MFSIGFVPFYAHSPKFIVHYSDSVLLCGVVFHFSFRFVSCLHSVSCSVFVSLYFKLVSILLLKDIKKKKTPFTLPYLLHYN